MSDGLDIAFLVSQWFVASLILHGNGFGILRELNI